MSKKIAKSRLPDVTEIDVSAIRIPENNPNVMSEWEFSQLCNAIREEGFDEPIKVIPDPSFEDDFHFLVISGSHRVQACESLGIDKIPAIIEKDWDKEKAEAYLVRRNLNRGHIDSKKLRHLVETTFGTFSPEETAAILGFENSTELKKMARIKDKAEFSPDELDKIENSLNESDSQMELIDGLHGMLASIFNEYGTDVEANFLAFVLNRKIQLLVNIGEEYGEQITKLVEHCREKDFTMNVLLGELIKDYLENYEDGDEYNAIDSDLDIAEEEKEEIEEAVEPVEPKKTKKPKK